MQIFEAMQKTAARYFPLGLGYISSYMKSKGHDVLIVDPEMQGITESDLHEIIKQENPGIVGLSSVTPNFSLACKMAKKIKSISGAVVVYGGIHASTFAERIIEHHPEFDIVVYGEGEETMSELASMIENNKFSHDKLKSIKGLCYRDNGTVYKTAVRPFIEDVDSLPFPDRDSIGLDVYKATGHIGVSSKVANVLTSRGCPARCTFCESFLTMGYKFRAHSADYVLAEIRNLKERYGVEQIVFNDDTFTINYDRVKTICERLIHDNYNIKWFCFARVNTIRDEEMLRLMKASGCVQINFGVETGDETIMKSIKKGITLDQARKAFQLTHKVGIKTSAGFIFGFPGETKDSIERTINFATELNPDVALFNVLVPFPGTETFQHYPQLHNEIDNPGFWESFKTASAGGDPVIELPGLTKEELKMAIVRANRRYYIRLGYLVRQLARIRSYYELKSNFIGALELLQKNIKSFSKKI
ncbi:MAG: hypothetical protein AMK71_08545 [Nitrospira bacterium SG8_35_4]|nr:MAG: hypothetical protein AMK71_08545 [Nitrospira bacterium SG8_35_4]